MKKFLLPVLGLGLMTSTAFGQILSEDFDSGLPSTWTVIDSDGLAAHSSLTGILDGWHAYSYNGESFVINNSYYTSPGTADDWLITPALVIPSSTTSGYALKFDAVSFNSGFPSTIEVKVSTVGTATADFTTTLTSEIVPGTWNSYQLDLSAYEGQTIYVAFHDISVDQLVVGIEDVVVEATENNDAELTGASLNNLIVGNKTVTFTVGNVGNNAITSYDINWSYDGANFTEAVTGVNVAIGGSNQTQVSLSVPSPIVDGAFSATVANVNGGVDPNTDNNTLSGTLTFAAPVPNFTLTDSDGTSHELHALLSSGKTVVLDFFASWCTPCETSTPALNSFYVANGSGANDLEVFGLTVESTDNTDAIMNNLGWGGTYPKFKYSTTNDEMYSHYSFSHGLNSGSIPFFVMICPNESDPINSTVIHSSVGYSTGMFINDFQPVLDACALDIEETVVSSEVSAFPNPAAAVSNINFALNANADVALTMVDMLGKVVYSTTTSSYDAGNHTISVDVSKFGKGMYLSTLTINGKAHNVKVTVE